MLPRVLEPEVMDSAEEARDYDAMDHSTVNRVFVADFLSFSAPISATNRKLFDSILDVGTGTAQIPIELCRQSHAALVVGIDMADHMLAVGQQNVQRAHFADRIRLQHCDAKKLPFATGSFGAVISNSIVHHIPRPGDVIPEMVRMVAPGGVIFVRDLLRPPDDTTVTHLVRTYAGDANAHQQKMFDDSLRAALALEEIRALVAAVGFDAKTVTQTSDRHWTWAAKKGE